MDYKKKITEIGLSRFLNVCNNNTRAKVAKK